MIVSTVRGHSCDLIWYFCFHSLFKNIWMFQLFFFTIHGYLFLKDWYLIQNLFNNLTWVIIWLFIYLFLSMYTLNTLLKYQTVQYDRAHLTFVSVSWFHIFLFYVDLLNPLIPYTTSFCTFLYYWLILFIGV